MFQFARDDDLQPKDKTFNEVNRVNGSPTVTRFGEISPLWEFFISLWPFLNGSDDIWQNLVSRKILTNNYLLVISALQM